MTKVVEVDIVIVGAGIVGIWVAYALAKRGHSVGIIERGSCVTYDGKASYPEIVFPNRYNEGAVRARNQVLTGNSRFWGGGIIRNETVHLRRIFSNPNDCVFLDQMKVAYGAVEEMLRIAPADRVRFEVRNEEFILAEVCVLSGKYRSLADKLLPELLANSRVHLHCESSVTFVEYDADSRLKAIEFVDAQQGPVRFVAKHYVLSMGVIDTNLFVQKHLMRIFQGAAQSAGTHLHDHWSVPIARCKWKKPLGDDWIFPVCFRGPHISGKRVELSVSAPWGVVYGFVHIEAPYSAIEPYATIKRLLEARQLGKSMVEQFVRGTKLAAHLPALYRIGRERWLKKQLYVSDGVELELVLDFESFPHRDNRIVHHGDKANLYWDIREEDSVVFAMLIHKMLPLVETWSQQHGLRFGFLMNSFTESNLQDFFKLHALDAFHLGGGLSSIGNSGVWSWGDAVQTERNRNIAVIGTAAFRRPGIANPVETLLAMSNVYVSSFA